VLRALELQRNLIDDECIESLSAGLCTSLTLTKLTLARNLVSDRGACNLSTALMRQRIQKDPKGQDQPCCLLELDLSNNPMGDRGAEAFARAATACTEDQDSNKFQVPWGLERLNLADTPVEKRGKHSLCSAVASRAALADASANFLASTADESVLRMLRTKRVRMPAGLTVLGLDLNDGPAAAMRDQAHSRLMELWPGPAIPADEAAGASLAGTPRGNIEKLTIINMAADDDNWGGAQECASPTVVKSPVSVFHMPLN